jgi:tetratricopeptide (TPR) repeat protein
MWVCQKGWGFMGIFGKKYDSFISYKSKNVVVARQIADRLIASGRKVWFAEYEVLLNDRDRFQEAIDRGIPDCKYGLALTNDDYAKSECCEAEIAQLLKVSGPEKVLEIMIPKEPLLRWVGETLDWEILSPITIAPANKDISFTGKCLGDTYTIDVSGWNLMHESFHGGGPCYTRNINGFDIAWNLQFGEEIDPRVYEARISQRDEREFYKYICNYGYQYFSNFRPGSRVIGAHLLWDYKGKSQLAITYYYKPFLKRKYSIMLLHPITNRAVEFVFTFEFTGKFEQYCHYAELMDNLVMTLRWGEDKEGNAKGCQEISCLQPSQEDIRFQRLIDDQPMANKFYQDGLLLAKQGQIREAIAVWEKVLQYTALPELHGATLYNLGRAYEKTGDVESALRSYRQSVETNPEQFNALCNIGSIYLRQNQPQEALKYLLEAAKINPNDKITKINIAICYEALNKSTAPVGDEELLKKAIKYNDKDSFKEALDCCNKALAVNSARDDTWDEKAYALWRLGRINEALYCCNQAIAAHSDFIRVYHTKGLLLEQLGQYEDAIASFQRYVDTAPPNYASVVERTKEKIKRLKTQKR